MANSLLMYLQENLSQIPVHIDRLKVVYVLRQPNPIKYFVPKVVTGEKQDSSDENSSDNQSQELRDKNETPVDTNVEGKYII
jgi:hypothetical protein